MTTHDKAKTYYELLHVSPNAPVEIIRGSYRTLMQKLKHHPDLGGDTETAAQINEAYAVLSNAGRRAEYDAELNAAAQSSSPENEPAAQEAPKQKTRTANTQKTPPPKEKPSKPEPVKKVLDPKKECLFCETKHAHGKVVDVDAVCANCHSPLFPSENCRIETAGKRAVVRLDQNQAVTFFTQWPQPRGFDGQTEDISLHGLRLVTRHGLAKGQRIKIISNVLEAVAVVMHCDKKTDSWRSTYVAGVSFEALRLKQTRGGFVSARA